MLRAGRIVYTNDLPVYAAFDAGVLRFPGTLTADVPAGLNRMLAEGELDLSPISAIAYARHADELVLLPDLCIGSRGDVWSVILVSARRPEELDGAVISVTTESASGYTLLRVLLEKRYGVRVCFVQTKDPLGAARRGEPTLLIGDSAIDAQVWFPGELVHDLGRCWHAWTGMDMVYAVWAARRDVLEKRPEALSAAMHALREACAWGKANAERVTAAAQALHPRSAGFYAAYYATLNFSFDDRARAGLARFFAESHAIGAIASIPSLVSEVGLSHVR